MTHLFCLSRRTLFVATPQFFLSNQVNRQTTCTYNLNYEFPYEYITSYK
jgi:hypothetical protein